MDSLHNEMNLTPMEQLLAFCDWERKQRPHPEGKTHIAEWAAGEIERLHKSDRANEDQLVRIAHCVGRDATGAPEHDRTVAGATIAELERLRAALAELVALKDLKDFLWMHNEAAEYRRRQPLAWAAARAALAPLQAPQR